MGLLDIFCHVMSCSYRASVFNIVHLLVVDLIPWTNNTSTHPNPLIFVGATNMILAYNSLRYLSPCFPPKKIRSLKQTWSKSASIHPSPQFRWILFSIFCVYFFRAGGGRVFGCQLANGFCWWLVNPGIPLLKGIGATWGFLPDSNQP